MHRGTLVLALLFVFLAICCDVYASEQDALAVSQSIQARHLPFGTILEPIFAAPDSDEIVGYTRCGDSAIWTGHYLAAETFRYVVTRSPEAFDNAVRAIDGLQTLVDVTGTNLLARCAIPADSPYAPGIVSEESQHGIYNASLGERTWYWVGDTSRDQYSGVFFGLSLAYDGLGDETVRSRIRDLVTRMLDFLRYHDWTVVMPNGTPSTSFLGRFDQELSLLAVGRQVNYDRFNGPYNRSRFFLAGLVAIPISFEVLDDHDSYYKFNLDTINLYDLVRLEESSFYRSFYRSAYDILRRTTDGHGNAHFNMIDRSLSGPDERRDAETRDLLEAWLRRPRRDFSVDWRGVVPACGEDRACAPIPVEDRVRTDFLWQRSPFLLYGGGDGLIETSGIDYILPYWMARYYGVL